MHPRTQSNRGKKSTPLLYAAFFLFLPICAATYMAASVRLWHDWQKYEAAKRMPPVIVDTVENAVPARPPVPAAVEEPAAEEIPSVEIIGPAEPARPENAAPIAIDFNALLAVNEDVVGWLYCPGTSINYPILQSEVMDGKLWRNPNTVIYGPLDDLTGYTSQDYYEEHPEIWLLTPDGDYCIHLLGGREIPSDAPFFYPGQPHRSGKGNASCDGKINICLAFILMHIFSSLHAAARVLRHAMVALRFPFQG